MEAEFKKDPRDDFFKLLEINARSWRQNSLPTKCGINIALIAYLDSIGKEIHYTEDYKAGTKWLYFRNDLRSCIKTSGDMTMKDWLVSLNGVRDWPFFAVDDLKPWIISNLKDVRAVTRAFLDLARAHTGNET